MSAAKLGFVGTAATLELIEPLNLTKEQRDYAGGIADPQFRETVKDYFVNRQFRRDIYSKGAVPLNALEAEERWNSVRLILTVPRGDARLSIKSLVGEAKLDAPVYPTLLDALADGPKSIRELRADQRLNDIRLSQLREAVMVFYASGQLALCRGEDGVEERALRTQRFNDAVLLNAEGSGSIGYLASPVTGSAETVDRVTQLFLNARSRNENPPEYAARILLRQNQRVLKDGKPIQSPEEHAAEIGTRYDTFVEKRLPVLQRLGIA